jgi:hypothetical protein
MSCECPNDPIYLKSVLNVIIGTRFPEYELLYADLTIFLTNAFWSSSTLAGESLVKVPLFYKFVNASDSNHILKVAKASWLSIVRIKS